MTKRRKHSSLTNAFAGVFLFAIFALIAWGLAGYVGDVMKASDAQSWPKAEATVLRSAPCRCGKRRDYFPHVQYQYRAGASSYISTRLVFGNVGCGSKSSAIQRSAQFPPGAKVQVHYNPAQPGQSVLIAGRVFWETWLGIALMSLFLVVSLVIALAFL